MVSTDNLILVTVYGNMLLGVVNALRGFSYHRRQDITTALFARAPGVGSGKLDRLMNGGRFKDLKELQEHIRMSDGSFLRLLEYIKRQEVLITRVCPEWSYNVDQILVTSMQALDQLTNKAKSTRPVGQLRERLDEIHAALELAILTNDGSNEN